MLSQLDGKESMALTKIYFFQPNLTKSLTLTSENAPGSIKRLIYKEIESEDKKNK